MAVVAVPTPDPPTPSSLVDLLSADPLTRLDRWKSASEADRFEWFLSLLNLCGAYAGTIEAMRSVVLQAERLSLSDLERMRARGTGL